MAHLQARFETPERKGGKLFLLAGYGQTSLDMDRSQTGLPGSEEFKSGNFGGGFEYRLDKAARYFMSAKWNRLYAEGGVEMNVTSLGLRFKF